MHGPRTDGDFRGEVARQDRPLMGHEIGQWTFFPNFDEIAKYTGVLQAKNFELVRDDLAKKHLLDLAPQFVQATGRQAVLLYKEEIEVLLRTPNYPGFSLLDLHDYPGQGTALIGPLDPFWDSKGFVTPEQHTRYCGPTVPLLRLKKRTFTSDETLTAEAEIAHFGPKDLAAAMPEWTSGTKRAPWSPTGRCRHGDIPTGKLSPLGQIEASLAKAAAPGKLTISLSLPGTPIANQWEIWVYPPKVNIEPPKGLAGQQGLERRGEVGLGQGRPGVAVCHRAAVRNRCRAGSCRSSGARSGSPRRSPTRWESSAIPSIRRWPIFPPSSTATGSGTNCWTTRGA